MKFILIVFTAAVLSACSSLTTVGSSDQEIASSLKRQGTYCENIPRVYSGVAYDFCHLHSSRDRVYIDWYLGFYLIDGLASGLVDTMLLPYTSYKQYKDGSLSVQQGG